MSQKIVDLDAALGEPIRVKLKGTIYKLPPDLPVELWLALGETDEPEEDAPELTPLQKADAMRVEVEELYTMILDLFREHQPDLEKLPIGMGQLVTLIGNVYGEKAKSDQGAAEGKAPRATARRGRQTSSRSK